MTYARNLDVFLLNRIKFYVLNTAMLLLVIDFKSSRFLDKLAHIAEIDKYYFQIIYKVLSCPSCPFRGIIGGLRQDGLFFL